MKYRKKTSTAWTEMKWFKKAHIVSWVHGKIQLIVQLKILLKNGDEIIDSYKS